MLTKITIKNFRSIPELSIDLSDSHSNGKSVAFIYGGNGAGKSNIISAIYFLLKTFRTIKDESYVAELNSRGPGVYPELESEELRYRVRGNAMALKELVRRGIRLGTDNPIDISFSFSIGDRKGSYQAVFSSEGLIIKEKLIFQIGSRSGVIFSIDEADIFTSPSAFNNKSYKAELLESIERYWGRHSFMSILFADFNSMSHRYFENKVSSHLVDVLEYLWDIAVYSEDGNIMPQSFGIITCGYVDRLEKNGLDNIERIINGYISKMFADIKRVYYRTALKGSRMSYELVFVREIGGTTVEIPYTMESSGIKKLMELFPFFISSMVGGIVFVDDVSSALHDLVQSAVISKMAESISGQLIATTHSTLIMKDLPHDSVYIIKVDRHGFKSIASVSDYSFRTQKNNNVQMKYLHGDYEGVPLIGEVNLKNLVGDIENS